MGRSILYYLIVTFSTVKHSRLGTAHREIQIERLTTSPNSLKGYNLAVIYSWLVVYPSSNSSIYPRDTVVRDLKESDGLMVVKKI